MENDENSKTQQNNWSYKKILLRSIRVIFVSGVIIAAFLNTIYGFVLPDSNTKCVVDYTHKNTSMINDYFIHHDLLRNSLNIIIAIIFDALFLTKMGYFIFQSKSWRFITTLILFFILRFFAQIMFQEKFPDGYAWFYPGIPSITVSYLQANDFYFNSTVGLMFICSLDFYYEKKKLFFLIGIFSIIVHSILLIILHANYIIDIFSSVIIAHFAYIIVSKYIFLLDHNKFIGFYRTQHTLKPNEEIL